MAIGCEETIAAKASGQRTTTIGMFTKNFLDKLLFNFPTRQLSLVKGNDGRLPMFIAHPGESGSGFLAMLRNAI